MLVTTSKFTVTEDFMKGTSWVMETHALLPEATMVGNPFMK